MSETALEPIIGGIAEEEGVDPEELELSLQDHVPTDAIRNLVEHDSDSWQLLFETQNHVVEVTGTGEVSVDGEEIREYSSF